MKTVVDRPALIDVLEQSDAHIAASVIDRTHGEDPFTAEVPDWIVHAMIISKLFAGMINRRELVSALIDEVSTLWDCAFDDTVGEMVMWR